MIRRIYSIFDRVTSTYGDPFIAVNDDDCKRKVAYSFKDNPYKIDLVLYCLGDLSLETGIISTVSVAGGPLMVCPVVECYSEDL